MTISYNWLSEYLTKKIDPEKLSEILTSIGLEVENMERYESVKGSLEGLVVGEVMTCDKHPNADKLKCTTVNIGNGTPLQIVCGAPNVEAGQKVIVAPVGATIFPAQGEPVTMKLVKIRSVESQGMICAEDEIGLGDSHAGILILDPATKAGTPASEVFKPYKDVIYEIGLTPNRMDAMSHLGVARDVSAYLSYHGKEPISLKLPFPKDLKADNRALDMEVIIENTRACKRYSGVSISGVEVKTSPEWLQQKLKAIGVRAINNIVDITNYILHETGQPLHAFDATAVKGRKVIVKNVAEGTPFLTLDGKERKLSAEDLMICNETEPMCIAGVFGGIDSGVKSSTTSIFLESAWFNPVDIRKTSLRHGLRTDAAARFEKGIDISNTVNVLKRAVLMIKDIAGGQIASEIIDVYPAPELQKEVSLTYDYLKRLSGKGYDREQVKLVFKALAFDVIKETDTEIKLRVPFHKTDISIPADLVEEILRIDGYDNVEIPKSITISPSTGTSNVSLYAEKIAGFLTGIGFNEIMTNSITNSNFYGEEVLQHSVKMLNSLSAELDIMRPSLLETGLQSVAYNLNRRNLDLRFFEYGKSYAGAGVAKYMETINLCVYLTGKKNADSWKGASANSDFYYGKGVIEQVLNLLGLQQTQMREIKAGNFEYGSEVIFEEKSLVKFGMVSKKLLNRFDIRQPVFFGEFNWDHMMSQLDGRKISLEELSKQLPVHRDLSIVVPDSLKYEEVEETIKRLNVGKLQKMQLFDVFESEKLGNQKKSMAISFEFLDKEKTLTDTEIDSMMNRIIVSLDKECQAEIRK